MSVHMTLRLHITGVCVCVGGGGGKGGSELKVLECTDVWQLTRAL